LCDKRDEQETDYISYMDHRKLAHSIFLKKNTIIHSYLEPNVNNPGFYCRSCETLYFTDMLPGTDDINFYCRICQASYRTLQNYKTHLKHSYDIVLKPFKGKMKDTLPDVDDPNFHISACNITHKTKFIYRSHLRNRHVPHKTGLNPNPALKSNLEDYNNYCCSCDMQLLCRKWYDNHLNTRHEIKVRNGTILPDWSNSNNYCPSCETSFSNIDVYQGLCRHIHKMNLQGTTEEIQKLGTTIPDLNNPNFLLYCL
jgi:hypothetical protein